MLTPSDDLAFVRAIQAKTPVPVTRMLAALVRFVLQDPVKDELWEAFHSNSAELRGEEERLLEQIRQKGLEWSRATLARFLLDEAKRRFEAERQRAVLREAARYFRTITDGRYVNILAPLDGGAIEVVEESGARKQASDLSRGAMEQLYLAIRFGYVTTSRDGMERLPLVMDDILVNADARRRREAAAGICEIAARQQVLYFTCHEETIETFRGLTENLSVIRLTSGKIEGS